MAQRRLRGLASLVLLLAVAGDASARRLRSSTPLSAACQGQPYTTYVPVKNTSELQQALNRASAGTLIELGPGTYDRPPFFNLTILDRRGLPDSPITICGPREAVVTALGNYANKPYVFLVRNCSYVTVAGFSMTKGLKGFVVENSQGVLASGLRVYDVDYEGIRVRYNSTNVTVQGCQVTDTGRTSPGTGEGIYIGSSAHQSNFDFTLDIQILNNTVGPGVPSECIDIKENARGGLIQGNTFDGSGLLGLNFADSWVDVKGSGYVVTGNIGTNTLLDGFQTHDQDPPLSGENNIFEGNICNMGAGTGGCVVISCDGDNSACNNTVKCSNVVIGGSGALTNLSPCTP